MKSQVRKVGNSHGIIIPKPLLDEIGIADGDLVNLKVNKKGRIVLRRWRRLGRRGASGLTDRCWTPGSVEW